MGAGFEQATAHATARAALREVVDPHGRTKCCPVEDAAGRVLAADVAARRDVPHYDRAAMDGYAVRAADTFDANERSPAVLADTDGPVEAGTGHAVHTGSAIPAGADAVVRVERVETDPDTGDVLVYDAVAVGKDVADAGEDVTAGEDLFDAGHRLSAADLALLRSTGVDSVTVAEEPTVAVLPTGDELVDADAEPAPGETVETNGPLLATLVEQWGGVPTYRDVVRDEADALGRAIDRDTDHDIIVTSGGSSVGERDIVADVVEDLGELSVHGVAIKPGHPVGFGHVDATPVLVLPGYPVSCLVTAVQFLRPAIAWSVGTDPGRIHSVRAHLLEKLPSTPGKCTFARVRFVDDVGADVGEAARSDGGEPLPAVELVRVSGAGVLSSVTNADGWVVVPEAREGIPADEVVTVEFWDRG